MAAVGYVMITLVTWSAKLPVTLTLFSLPPELRCKVFLRFASRLIIQIHTRYISVISSSSIFLSFFLSLLVRTFLHTHCKCSGLLLNWSHSVTHTHTHTCSRTPLDEGSARHRVRHIHNKHRRDTSIPPDGIRTWNNRKRTAADPQIRPRGHRDRRSNHEHLNKFWKAVGKINLDSLGI
jgi:hypothetical protein